MKVTRMQKGITLIALIITIVGVLILAGISIATIQESDIIGKAKEAVEKYEAGKSDEESKLQGYEDILDSYISGQGGEDIVTPPGDKPVGAIDSDTDPLTIGAIEDLVEFAIAINAGDPDEIYTGKTVTLETSLDFEDPGSYRTQNPATTVYTQDGVEIDVNGDGTVEPIMTEMIGTKADDGTRIGVGFKSIGGMSGVDANNNPIMNSFKGTFDGTGNSILNLYINRPDEMVAGLFATIDLGTTIKDLELTGDVTVNIAQGFAGGIVGMVYGQSAGEEINISNCKISNIKVQGACSGGVIGGMMQTQNITITNCNVDNAIITAYMSSAGICPYIISEDSASEILIKKCSVDKDSQIMMNANEDEGGISSAGICLVAGVGNLTIKECTNNGKIVSNNVYSSGIANALINGDLDIQNCINYGIVEGYGERTIVAGVFIHSGMNSYEVCESNAIIKECVNEGTVKSSGTDRNSVWYDETRIGGVCIIAAMSVDMQNCENNGTIESSSYYTAGLGFCFALESNISNCKNNKDIMINEDLPVVSGLIISSMQAETNASDVMTCNNLENNGKIIANLKEGSDKVQVGYVAGCVVTLNDNIDYIASKLIMNNCINNGDIDLRNAKYNESMKVDGIAIPNGHPIVEKSECVNNANILTPTN